MTTNTTNPYTTAFTAADLRCYTTTNLPSYANIIGSYITNSTSLISQSTCVNNEELSPIDKKIKEQIKINKKESGFINIKEYVPNKVYEFTFIDYGNQIKIKTICDNTDTFDLETAFFLALAKRKYPRYTPEGHLYMAKELSYDKAMIKRVKHGIKLFNLLKEKEEYDKLQEEKRKQQHEKYVAKKKKQKERKKEQADLRLYKTIKDAIEDAR